MCRGVSLHQVAAGASDWKAALYHSVSLYPLVETINLFTFKLIIDMYFLILILLIVWGLFLYFFFFLSVLFSCYLMTNFSVMFGFPFPFCLCIYCLFLVCS